MITFEGLCKIREHFWHKDKKMFRKLAAYGIEIIEEPLMPKGKWKIVCGSDIYKKIKESCNEVST